MIFDAIIVGGSYAGLSTAMALGRSIRKVLIIDSGNPCNRQTPHSHNFLTQDGQTPAAIHALALTQVLAYPTVQLVEDKAIRATGTNGEFTIHTESGEVYTGKKILLATGISDQMRPIPGFSECWGISIIHCPYCHGYEVKGQKTGILSNSSETFEFAKILMNWTKDLHVFTDGACGIPDDQKTVLEKHSVGVNEGEIVAFVHNNGQLREVVFKDGSSIPLSVLYARINFVHSSDLYDQLGCKLAESGHIEVDQFYETTVKGVYSAGDAVSKFRSVAMAVASGAMAGATLNKSLIDDEFAL